MAYNIFKLRSYLSKDEDGPEEMWKPYMTEIAQLTLDAAKNYNKIVLTFAAYRQSYREWLVKQLVEGGAKKENITILQLTINPEVKLEGLYYRTKRQVENDGESSNMLIPQGCMKNNALLVFTFLRFF